MPKLGEVITRRVTEWEIDDLPLERALFGSADADVIADAVDSFCRRSLGAPIERYVFFDSSSGSVHGVVLQDARAVVVKGHRASVSNEYLETIAAVQADLARSGFPAPRPLVSPTACGTGHLTAETLLACPRDADGHDDTVRRALARGLRTFIGLAEAHRPTLANVSHPMAVEDGALYPPPHSSRFDFGATATGAEWIDALASAARDSLRSSEDLDSTAVVHGDWRIENVCVARGELAAVYDWDSVHVDREMAGLATAATTFSIDWTKPQPRRFPTPAEIRMFLVDYEEVRGVPLGQSEQSTLCAAMVASLAYGARCEHADPGRPPSGDDSHRGLLAQLGHPLLDRGLDVLE